MRESVTLYHGTCRDHADDLLTSGWTPATGRTGGSCGQRRYLYLTTDPEDALWFANEKGDDVVLVLHDVPLASLIVDPEDGIGETVEQELAGVCGMPGKLALTEVFPASGFSDYARPPAP